MDSEIEAAGVLLACKAWNNGFRQLTSTRAKSIPPEDFKGFKMRVPAAPILTSLFQALGGSDAHQFQRTLFCVANQDRQGQENPLPIIATAKLYEVQKYCSLTAHVGTPT